MLSKNDDFLSYPFSFAGMTTSSSWCPFVADASGSVASPFVGLTMGSPEAIASFTSSCLLNFALALSKSKSSLGTSTVFG